jgi:hypothetical protein
MKTFFHHLTLVDDIYTELDGFEMDPEDKTEIVELIHQIVHHHSLNVILNHLPREYHEVFLTSFKENPEDDKHWQLLRSQIKEDLEAAIKTQAEKIKKEILLEVKRSKRS